MEKEYQGLLIGNIDKEAEAKIMFQKLKEHIGEEVSYKAWYIGLELNGSGELQVVRDFSSVVIDHLEIPFVGFRIALSTITAKNGEILYVNPYIEKGYDRNNEASILRAKIAIFGKCAMNTDENVGKRKQTVKSREELDMEAKKLKNSLMREGLGLIKASTAKDWLRFVEVNTNDAYCVLFVKAVISMMKKFEKGVSFPEAEHQVYNVEMNLPSHVVEKVVEFLLYFAPNGKEYKDYRDQQHKVTTPTVTEQPKKLYLK